MLIEREELIKKIEETDTSEIIENEMNFKFKDLELIGMHRNRYDEILYYKNDEKIYVIKIINGYIYTIDFLLKENTKKCNFNFIIKINGKNFKFDFYSSVKLLHINNKEMIIFNFYDKKINFKNNKKTMYGMNKIKLANEELVMIELLNDFMNKEEFELK